MEPNGKGGALALLRQELRAGAARAVAGGAAVQQVGLEGLITAVKCEVPRDLKQVAEEVMQEADAAGAEMYYTWTVRNRDGSRELIEGPSVEMANAMLRAWGNAAVRITVTHETATHWRLKAVFVDVQKGVVTEREFQQRKSGIAGKYENDRKLDIAFQIGQSKARRNVILDYLPRWLAERAIARAKRAAARQLVEGAGGPRKLRDNIEALFATRYDVPLAALEARLGKGKDKWQRDDCALLWSVHKALEDGQTSPAEEFPGHGAVRNGGGSRQRQAARRAAPEPRQQRRAPEPPPPEPSAMEQPAPPPMAEPELPMPEPPPAELDDTPDFPE